MYEYLLQGFYKKNMIIILMTEIVSSENFTLISREVSEISARKDCPLRLVFEIKILKNTHNTQRDVSGKF